MIVGTVRGALAGVMATAFMTLWMIAGTALRLMKTPAPEEIAANAARQAGRQPEHAPEPAFHASWFAAHVAFGAVGGILYTWIRPYLPRPASAAGNLFGAGVWATSYLGWLPALGLYPSPGEDSPSRQAVMISAHAVYGVTLAETLDRL
jgi:hypothetical protein